MCIRDLNRNPIDIDLENEARLRDDRKKEDKKCEWREDDSRGLLWEGVREKNLSMLEREGEKRTRVEWKFRSRSNSIV